jgi:hypothetical protein
MAEEKQIKKSAPAKDTNLLRQKDREVIPDGFVEVHFKFVGKNKANKGKVCVAYVKPEIAEIYKKKKELDKNGKVKRGSDNIVKIGDKSY